MPTTAGAKSVGDYRRIYSDSSGDRPTAYTQAECLEVFERVKLLTRLNKRFKTVLFGLRESPPWSLVWKPTGMRFDAPIILLSSYSVVCVSKHNRNQLGEGYDFSLLHGMYSSSCTSSHILRKPLTDVISSRTNANAFVCDNNNARWDYGTASNFGNLYVCKTCGLHCSCCLNQSSDNPLWLCS